MQDEGLLIALKSTTYRALHPRFLIASRAARILKVWLDFLAMFLEEGLTSIQGYVNLREPLGEVGDLLLDFRDLTLPYLVSEEEFPVLVEVVGMGVILWRLGNLKFQVFAKCEFRQAL